MKKRVNSIENVIINIISVIIIIGGALFFIIGFIGAILYFSWYSILMIPFCLLGIASITWICYLSFSKDIQEQYRKTWNQAHDV